MVWISELILYPEVVSQHTGLTFRWRIFVDYLSCTAAGVFNQTALKEQMLNFELQWQLEKWGTNDDEQWDAVGDLGEILAMVQSKWGNTFNL